MRKRKLIFIGALAFGLLVGSYLAYGLKSREPYGIKSREPLKIYFKDSPGLSLKLVGPEEYPPNETATLAVYYIKDGEYQDATEIVLTLYKDGAPMGEYTTEGPKWVIEWTPTSEGTFTFYAIVNGTRSNDLTIVVSKEAKPPPKGKPDFMLLYWEPTVTEIQLQREDGSWITIWSGDKTIRIEPDKPKQLFAEATVPAGTYIYSRFKCSSLIRSLELYEYPEKKVETINFWVPLPKE